MLQIDYNEFCEKIVTFKSLFSKLTHYDFYSSRKTKQFLGYIMTLLLCIFYSVSNSRLAFKHDVGKM